MAISSKLKSYLDKKNIHYQILEHDVAYTALEIAKAQHIPGRQFVKSVILNADGKYILCVLPSIHFIDMEKCKNILKAQQLSLAEEEEVAKLFPEYEVGGEPPFGQLSSLPVYMDKILQEDEEIAFNAGNHSEIIKMKLSDYIHLVNPIFVDIGIHI